MISCSTPACGRSAPGRRGLARAGGGGRGKPLALPPPRGPHRRGRQPPSQKPVDYLDKLVESLLLDIDTCARRTLVRLDLCPQISIGLPVEVDTWLDVRRHQVLALQPGRRRRETPVLTWSPRD